VTIEAKASVHEDVETKKKYWNPMWEQYFQTPENKEFVVLKFVAKKIEYTEGMTMEVWEK
jgi:general stress protein 26